MIEICQPFFVKRKNNHLCTQLLWLIEVSQTTLGGLWAVSYSRLFLWRYILFLPGGIDIYPLRIYTTIMNYGHDPLTPAVFYILLALSIKERHGYDIMKQVESDSHGKVKMGPGTLYGSIKRMLETGLIVEVNNSENTRRKFYRLTKKGQKHLSAEIQRYSEIVDLAKNKNLLGIGNLDLSV